MKDRKYDLWFWSIIARYLIAAFGCIVAIKAALIGDYNDDLMLQLVPWFWI